MLPIAGTADALVHDGKCKTMTVGCHSVSGKSADTFDGSRLGPYAMLRGLSVATTAKGAVLTHDRECGKEGFVEIGVVPGMAENVNKNGRRRIIIEGKSATVGDLEVLGMGRRPMNECLYGVGGLPASGISLSAMRCKMIEKHLCHQVITAFEHGLKHLLKGVGADHKGADTGGSRGITHGKGGVGMEDSGLDKGTPEMGGKGVAAIVEEGGQRRVVIVPAPSPTQGKGVLDGTVENYGTTDFLYPRLAHGINEGVHVIGAEKGVEGGLDDERTVEGVDKKCGAEAEIVAERLDGCRSSDDLFARCGTQTLVLTMGNDEAVGGKVVDAEAQLRIFEEGKTEQAVDTLAHDSGIIGNGGRDHSRRGRRCGERHRVGRQRLGRTAEQDKGHCQHHGKKCGKPVSHKRIFAVGKNEDVEGKDGDGMINIRNADGKTWHYG